MSIPRGHGVQVARPQCLRDNVTPYAAAYVALAEGLGCPVVTADTRLARATGLRCDVRLLISAGRPSSEA